MSLQAELSTRQPLLFDLLTRRSYGPTVDTATGVNKGSRNRRQLRHRWHNDYRIWFAILLVYSTCAINAYHVQRNEYALSSLATTSGPLGGRSPLTRPITGGLLSPDLRRRQDGGNDDDNDDDHPTWADYKAISSNTLPLSNTVAPVFMHHLPETNDKASYNGVYLVSAFVDPRPLVVPNARREILIHGVMDETRWTKPGYYLDGIIECTVLIRQPDGTVITTTGSVKSWLAPHRSGKFMTLSQTQLVCSLARMPQATYNAVDWEMAEIYVTVNLIDVPPPNDVFIRVRPVAALDLAEYHTGRGQGGVCIAPLRGELYSSSFRDHISYQRSLGFTRIYIYLMDPGPITLSVLRKLASADPNIVLVRWGTPRNWSKMKPLDRDFEVDPSEWNVPGIEVLEPAREALLGTAKEPSRVGLWYWGQVLAAQDCLLRTMAHGARWVASIDWDEYFVLQPTGKSTWDAPPRSADPIVAMEPFLQWARDLPRPQNLSMATGYILESYWEKYFKVDVEALTKGMLPTSMIFAHSFGESDCRARTPPPQTPVLKEVMDRFGSWDWVEPGVTVPQAFSTPVAHSYLYWGKRSKKVLSPWAYFLDGTHSTDTGYATYAIESGACSSSSPIIENKEMSRLECVETVVRAFGGHGIPVPITKAVVTNRPNFGGPSSKVTGSSGSLRHFRVKRAFLWATLQLTNNLTDLSPSLLSSPESRKVRSDHSSHDCVQWPEEWSVVQVMEQSLKWIFEDRTEATTPTHQRPTPKVVVTSTPGSKPARPSIKQPAKAEPGVLNPTQHGSGASSGGMEMEEVEAQPTKANFKLQQAWCLSPYLVSTGALMVVAAAAALIYLLVAKARDSKKPPEGYMMVEQEQA